MLCEVEYLVMFTHSASTAESIRHTDATVFDQ